MSRIRKIFRLSKKDKGRGDHPTATHFSGQSTAHPRSSEQPTLHPQIGHQPTLDPPFGGHSTPNLHFNDQNITDPYPGGQHRLGPPSDLGDHPTATHSIGQSTPDSRPSGQPIDDGIYVITNVQHKRFVYLEDPNDNTPLRGHHRPGNRNAQWLVRSWGNEEYSIENVEHNRYAYCGSLAGLKVTVEGYNTEQLWRILTRPTGEYTIATTDTRNLWMLPYGEPGTPIELFNISTDRRCWWTFKKQDTGAPANDGQRILDPHSSSQHTLNLSLDLISAIDEATDLLKPLKDTCGALKVVLQMAKNIDPVDEDWKGFIRRLRFHLATIENHLVKLEEDQAIDRDTPALDQALREALQTYARELEEVHKLLLEINSETPSAVRRITHGNHRIIITTEKTRNMNDTFQKYTVALHLFAASTVSRMQQGLAQFQGELLGEVEASRLNRVKVSNAYGIQHRECLQGTREKTLQAIGDWVDDKTAKKWIFFFLDVAGSGKSTVAKHMAEKWKREQRLLARFFFSRDTTETMSTNSFCSTVAGAFADLDPNFKDHMKKFMERSNVGLLPFEELFDGLVAGPLKAAGRHAILIIDALDECHPEQRDQLLETLCRQHEFIPLLRILATGRPERDIKRCAEAKFNFGYTNFTRLEESEKDVELYINHRLQDLPIVEGRLYPVIRHAEGLFIWARIACDLLVDSDDVDGLLEQLGKEVSLDYLYKVALEQSMPKEGASRRAMVLVLQMILAAREPLSIAELEILSPKRGVVEKVVVRLGSVLLYRDREDPIRLLHATFREFLTSRSKADIFFIQPELGHHILASGCLNAIKHLSDQDNSALRKLDKISDRKAILILTHGSITIQCRTENWL